MNKTTYTFHTSSGVIPGIPNPENPNGEFHAGQDVDVDLDTMQVLDIRLRNAPETPPPSEPPPAPSGKTATKADKGA